MKKYILIFLILLFNCKSNVRYLSETSNSVKYIDNKIIYTVNIIKDCEKNDCEKCISIRDFTFILKDSDIYEIERIKAKYKPLKKIVYSDYTKFTNKFIIEFETELSDKYYFLIVKNDCLNLEEKYVIFN